jgi:uncharacterized protein (UPF0332 family)
MIQNLLEQAGRLANSGSLKPKQIDLRRAVSSAYYAVFHSFCLNCADTLVGTSKKSRPNHAWQQVYRGLDHGSVKSACEAARNIEFPQPIKDCADAFVELQKQRHNADYDPNYRITRLEALEAVTRAKQAVKDLQKSPLADRKAFAVQVLIKKR